MKIKDLSHITLICKDLDKTAHLFKTLFGAEEVYSSGDKTFSISKEKFFMIAGIWFAIMEGPAVDKTYNHIAFSIDEKDLFDFEKKINELKLTLLPARDHKTEEGRSIYFYDYDNHLFELHRGDLKSRLHFYSTN